jgi:hypothetical protein
VRIRESGLPLVETNIRMQTDLLLYPAAEACDDVVFLRDDAWKVGGDILGSDSPARGIPRVMRDLRPVDHRFGGRAPRIDACAADIAHFDQCDLPSYLGKSIGKWISRLP